MTVTGKRLAAAVEAYLADLRRIRASGGATGERSYYPPLNNLLAAVGATLKPRVYCVGELAHQGAGHPDFGLYAARQVQRGRPRDGQLPDCGVVEVKPVGDDAWLTAESDQVSKYWRKYRLVLVTNTRDFVLLGEDPTGNPTRLETFRLAPTQGEFETRLETPRAFARDVGPALGEYLCRALSHLAALVEPKDLAWRLASYARDGLARVEAAGDAPSLRAVRSALEEALGVRFEGDRGIPNGLAADNVYVLDPCCGTGAYLAEVLRRIASNLQDRGLGALTGAQVKRAATGRVFGFEIMPAPFVVAHLQVGLTMQALDAPLAEDGDGDERAGIFLTNALTGWEPREHRPVPFPELEDERDRAEKVKQEVPILVILGNPPYNGFAGVAMDEEWELLEAYRKPKQVNLGDARGLNDLYVRFFRMAERRIAEKTGRGIVCFISNYSWLDGLSFTGMRERYLEAFDAIRIDCLNGDKYRTGKTTPDGDPDPSIFSTPEDPVGIQVGTAITTLVRKRKADHAPANKVAFRHLWGQTKREDLIATAETEPDALYDCFAPSLSLGLPFARMAVSDDWPGWPSLPDLFPISFPGVHTGRDRLLVDIDLNRLRARIVDYFNPSLTHEEIAVRYPAAMRNSSAFKITDARVVRDALLARGGPHEAGFVRDAYRPFDNRWLYWEADRRLLTAPSPDYWPHVFDGNLWLSSAQHLRKGASEPQACVARHVGSFHLIERGAAMFPAWLRDTGLGTDGSGAQRRPNLSPAAHSYLERLGLGVEDLFHHVLAVLHDPAYREANAGALRMEWPRIPLPGWPDGGDDGAADELAESAARGRDLAALLDTDTPVPGVTEPRPGAPSGSALRPEIAAIAVPSTTDDANMTGGDFALTAGWGHFGQGEAVMPGQGRAVERPYTASEQAALANSTHTPGDTTTPRTEHDSALPSVIPALSRNPVPVRCDNRPHPQRRRPNPRRHHLRHIPQRPRLLAQRPRRRLALQARRLPGPQEVALLPRAQSPRPPPPPRRSPTLHQHRPPHRRHPPTGVVSVQSRGEAARPLPPEGED